MTPIFPNANENQIISDLPFKKEGNTALLGFDLVVRKI